MPLPEDCIASPGIILRPMLATRHTGKETSFIGGAPQLPDKLDWPTFGPGKTPLHFFAQIDLSQVPPELNAGGVTWPISNFPASGFLQVFLPLEDTMIYDWPPVLLYFEDQENNAERMPPIDLPDLGTSKVVDFELASQGGKLLPHAALEFLPYMSFRRAVTENGEEQPTPATQELITAATQASLTETLGQPQPGSAEAIALAQRFQDHIALTTPPGLDQAEDADLQPIDQWQMVFEWSREFIMSLIDEILRVANGMLATNNGPETLPQAVNGFETLKRRFLAINHAEAGRESPNLNPPHLGWFTRIWSGLVASNEVDIQALRWMRRAKGKSAQMSPAEIVEFTQFLQRIEDQATSTQYIKLQMLRGTPGVTIKRGKLRQAAAKAISHAAKERGPAHDDPNANQLGPNWIAWQAKVARSTYFEGVGPIQGYNQQPLQMFGEGDDIQSTAFENRDKIMLLQLGNRFGTGINYGDTAIQIWISPKDLAQGRFDRIEHTVDAS